MAMTRGYVQKWRPPPTVDDYMWEVQQNMWWGEKERARRQILWLMDIFLGDDDGKGSFSKIEGGKGEEGENGSEGVECH
jgi:hypothetical protein